MAKADALGIANIPADPARDERLGWWIIALTLGVFLGWGLWAQLEAGALAVGEVIPAGRVRTVQHLEGGMIKAIKVRDGDRVTAGQELLELDDREIRALIEITDRELAGLKARMADVDREIAGWLAREQSLSTLYSNADEESRINKELFDKSFIARPRVLQLESQKAQARGLIDENAAEISRARQKRSELEFASASARERRDVAAQRLSRLQIKAPESGVVNNLQYATIGGVIPAGGRVLDIVPDSEDLVVEARVSPDDIDVVRVGMDARVKLTAYKARSHIAMTGRVIGISGTTIKDDASPASPYYRVRVEIPATELQKADAGNLTPGMLAEVSLISGRRSPLRYLLDPIRDSMQRAFKES